jgi:hypothetical protein
VQFFFTNLTLVGPPTLEDKINTPPVERKMGFAVHDPWKILLQGAKANGLRSNSWHYKKAEQA